MGGACLFTGLGKAGVWMFKTVAAIATPAAVGGVSVIRISGEGAIPAAERVFRASSGRLLSGMKGYTAAYGQIYSGGQLLDDGIVTIFRAPKSYTGEDVAEISCHGGLLVTKKVLRAVLESGASLAEPGEFTRRAFLNGKMTLTQAEAVAELIGAGSEQGLRAARSAMNGALYQRISGITGRLLKVSSHLAAYIDYPEEDVEAVTSESLLMECEGCLDELSALLAAFDRGKVIREGVETVIVGRPNVGKSTLMNLLSGCQKSIVTDIPGTTRDVVEELVNLGDVTLRLADTAGIRQTENPVEQLGVSMALERLETAGVILAVFDLSEPMRKEDEQLIGRLEGLPVIVVLNKNDLPLKFDITYVREKFPHCVKISAAENQGVEALNKEIVSLLSLADLSSASAILQNERQRDCAFRAKELLKEVCDTVQAGYTLDAVDAALESALSALMELSGERVSDAVIDEVFSHFCVGK